MSTIVYDRIWYAPTFLKNKTDSGCTLLGHIYQIRKSDKGNFNLNNKADAWEFSDEHELVSFINRNKAVELPLEAEGQPLYVPDRVKNRLKKLKAES
jgi:hypothetical protein